MLLALLKVIIVKVFKYKVLLQLRSKIQLKMHKDPCRQNDVLFEKHNWKILTLGDQLYQVLISAFGPILLQIWAIIAYS